MKKIFYLASMAIVALGLSACGSAEKMAKQAELVTVNCNPSPLVVKGGNITADIIVSYPENYFNKKAILEVTPVLVYEGGEVALEPLMYQGEKVKDNYKVVPAAGGAVKETVTFKYVEGMAKSTLELRGRCTTNGTKWVTLPTKKAADGCNITETLLCTKGAYGFKESGYQAVITSAPEGQVMYRINSAEVRSSELKSASVEEFKAVLKEVAQNDRKALKNIEIVAYASPDGGESLNAKLSDNRSKTADNAFKKVVKKTEAANAPVSVKSVGQDWEGFQDLVNNSSIEDKDLILRVLGMYSDPNVREREIKNMSSVYQDLAKDVLPQLRRARFIANVEFTNYTDAELLQLVKENSDVLDEPALLKSAELCKDKADKVALLNKAVEKYNSAKAKYDLACIALCTKDNAEAAIAKCDAADADVINLQGVVAARNGEWDKAAAAFKKAGTADAQKNLGMCAIAAGNYSEAVAKCGDKGYNAALAQLLNGNVTAAEKALCSCDKPAVNYLHAIICARQGKVADAKAYLKKATDADATLAKRAATDIEFANLQ